VIALIDSSKFGKEDLTPFARLDQIAHFDTKWPSDVGGETEGRVVDLRFAKTEKAVSINE